MTDNKTINSDKTIEDKKRVRNIKSIIIAAAVSAFLGSFIGVFFILDEKPNVLYFIGEFVKNFNFSLIFMVFSYVFIIRKKIPHDEEYYQLQSHKNNQLDYDPMHPAYGVNNPASPFCHHRNSFSERYSDYQ